MTGFADSLGSASKVWYTLGDGELENVFYPETDTPDTFGLQYIVTDGSSFANTETANTTHAISLADPTSLVWQQVNTATNGDFKITKTYIADPSRSVVLIQTTFDNLSSTPLQLYADYLPQLNNDGMGNTGGTDAASGDLVASNGPVSSALAASTGFTQTTTGYVGTSSDGSSQLASSHALTRTYCSAPTAGHIVQVGADPGGRERVDHVHPGAGFDTSQSAAISDAAASLATGFSSLESSFESGWHSWVSGLNAPPASVTGSAPLEEQYYVSLMELKADEDKTYTGGFIAAPTDPWGTSVSANSGRRSRLPRGVDPGRVRDGLRAAGGGRQHRRERRPAVHLQLRGRVQRRGQAEQFLNGNTVFGSLQMDEVADPIILAWQLGATNSADWGHIEALANYLVSNGPYTPQERWEENGGYSPATMAAEIAGLICAASIAETNGGDQPGRDLPVDGAGLGVGGRQPRRTPPPARTAAATTSCGSPRTAARTPGASISIANGGGSHDDRTVVDPSFLELVRLGIKAATATDITNTLSVVDSELKVTTPEGPIWHRYNFDGYGETASGGDYTGSGVGNPWPVLTGERGEYDVADGNLTGAQSHAADHGGRGQLRRTRSPSRSGAAATGTGGFTFGQPDNSSTPLMWAMAQYVRLAIDISAGQDVDTPAVVTQCVQQGNCPVSGSVKETVNVTVPVNTDASGDTVYLAGNLSALGLGQSDWAAERHPDDPGQRRHSGPPPSRPPPTPPCPTSTTWAATGATWRRTPTAPTSATAA